MKRATLLLADDHPAVLDRLVDMLSADFDIVGTVGDGQAASEAAMALRPDAVVFDISMPVLTGL
jgi:DNA-binding NarL/FixJ family response regulator